MPNMHPNDDRSSPSQACRDDALPAAAPTLTEGSPWQMSAAEPALHVSLVTLVDLLGGATQGVSSAGAERFAVRRVARGASVVHEGAPASSLFVVQSGSFKCIKAAEDGSEHVLGFTWRGDVIGFDGVGCAHYAFGAVALEDSRVVALSLATLDALRRRVHALDAALMDLLARQLTHVGAIAMVKASVAADVRLARFLVQLSERMATRGQSRQRLLLRMSRRDIANHLGVAHETISRALRVLIDSGWLRVREREVEILDLEGLKRCARCSRALNARVSASLD
jgi:CRP/FNR family transcriptional regulator